jgi:SAM-dependent methyltransferase
MDEASKTLSLLSERELSALQGKGLDIGAGRDPVRPDVRRFDVEHGDANCITQVIRELESFDYVFSSHCLEHMRDPIAALEDWWKLVKPGGALFVIVPDEDLYEQGYWPSIFNSDHKSTFTISKQTSWSPVSRNLLELMGNLPGVDRVSVRLQDHGYRRKYLTAAVWPRGMAAYAGKVRSRVRRLVPPALGVLETIYSALRLPIDQTQGTAVAQALAVAFKASRGSEFVPEPLH